MGTCSWALAIEACCVVGRLRSNTTLVVVSMRPRWPKQSNAMAKTSAAHKASCAAHRTYRSQRLLEIAAIHIERNRTGRSREASPASHQHLAKSTEPSGGSDIWEGRPRLYRSNAERQKAYRQRIELRNLPAALQNYAARMGVTKLHRKTGLPRVDA